MPLRGEGKLDKRIYELIVLTVARHWSAQYAWAVHEPIARGLGFSEEMVEAIKAPPQSPSSAKPEEALVYDAVTELLAGKVLSHRNLRPPDQAVRPRRPPSS